MQVAIMQPYFFPYAGYFRLIKKADIFVIFDCVQFPRRGWVHRNRIETSQNKFKWLTLPLKKQKRTTLIQQLAYSFDAQRQWKERLSHFSHLLNFENNPELYIALQQLQSSPIDTLISNLQLTCKQLSLPTHFIRSSELSIPAKYKAQERVIQICKTLKATHYLNAPGGYALYSPTDFSNHGIKLQFLERYKGSYQSILQRLFNENIKKISSEINNN